MSSPPSSQPRRRDVSVQLREFSQHTEPADPEQGTRHYNPPEDLPVPLLVTSLPLGQGESHPDFRVVLPHFIDYISEVHTIYPASFTQRYFAFLDFIHIVMRGYRSFTATSARVSTVCVHRIVSSSLLPVDRHLGRFQLGAATYGAAVRVFAGVSWSPCACVPDGRAPTRRTTEPRGLHVSSRECAAIPGWLC